MRKRRREENHTMEEIAGGGGGGGYWGWAVASAAQLALGIKSYLKGHSGDSRFMPFKAFTVSSLFVGATATAAVAGLRSSGIHSVEDMKQVGANIRTGLGVPPRAQDK